jgi:hypothetical protein
VLMKDNIKMDFKEIWLGGGCGLDACGSGWVLVAVMKLRVP